MISELKDKWETLTPRYKQLSILGGAALVIIIVVFAGADKKSVKRVAVEKNTIQLIDTNAGSMDMEQLVGQNQLLSTKVISMQEKLDVMSENFKSVKRSLSLNSELAETPQLLYDLKRNIEMLQKEQERLSNISISSMANLSSNDSAFIDDIANPELGEPTQVQSNVTDDDIFGDTSSVSTTAPRVKKIPNNPLAYVNEAYENSSEQSVDGNQYVTNTDTTIDDQGKPGQRSGISIVKAEESEQEKKPTTPEKKWIGAVLPAGTLIPGIVISGVDAPTGKAAEKGAVVSTMRITGAAILPNGERVDLKGCFVVNDVRGDLATQRANFRPISLTCTLADIGVVDTAIQGYVSGKDGTLGFRGKVVNKQGSALMYAGAAGVIGGFGNAFSGGGNSGSPTITTGGQFDLPSTDDAMTAGIGQGISEASSTLSEYYKEQLDLLYPIIEIKPMIFGSIHLIKTVQLTLFKANK